MQVVVHGGMQKTGSSALQEYLANYRSELRDLGVIYPDFGHRGHWLLSAAFTKNPAKYHHAERRLDGEDVQVEVDSALRKLAETITRAGEDEIVLLSHEDLSVVYKAQKLRDFVAEVAGQNCDFSMLAYIRNPIEHFPSAIQQALKAGKDRVFAPSSWFSPHLGRATPLEAALGKELTYRAHSPIALKNQDIIEDFRHFMRDMTGKDMPVCNTAIDVNVSISAQACAILQVSELFGNEGPWAQALRRAVRQFDGTQPKSKLVVPAKWKDHVAKVNGPAWNSIVQTMDYDIETKAGLRIEVVDTEGEVSDAEVCDWVLSYLDLDYADALLYFCRNNTIGNRGQSVAGLLERMIERVRNEGVSGSLKIRDPEESRKGPNRKRRSREFD